MKKIYGLMLVGMLTVLTACSQGKSAKNFHQDGVDCFNNGNYEEAEEYLAQAVTKNPDKAEYYIDYGMALIKTGDFEKAHIQFDKAILDKDNKIVRENNKRAHRGKGIAYFENAEYASAVTEFDSAYEISELDKLNLDILYYKGESEEKSGKYKEALTTYNEILKSEKSDSSIYAKLGQISEELGNAEDAIDYYDKAIKMDGKNYDLFFGKYFMLMSLEREEEAKAVLADALKINSTAEDVSYQMGRLHFYQENYSEAESELNASTEKGYNEAYYYLGEIRFKEKDYEAAIKNYENYITKVESVKSAAVYNQLGVALIYTENYEKALEYIQKGILLNDESKMYNLLFNEITAYEHLADFDTALVKADDFLVLYPKDKKVTKERKFILTRITEKEKEEKENGGDN